MYLSDHIRNVLTNHPDMSTTDLIAKLATIRIVVKPGLVYVVRSQMKLERQSKLQEKIMRPKNEFTMRQYVEKVLNEATKPLTIGEIGQQARLMGYKSTDQNYRTQVGKKVNFLVELGTATKENINGVNKYKKITAVATPVVASTEISKLTTIDPSLLIEVGKLIRKVGGVENLQPYINTVKELIG